MKWNKFYLSVLILCVLCNYPFFYSSAWSSEDDGLPLTKLMEQRGANFEDDRNNQQAFDKKANEIINQEKLLKDNFNSFQSAIEEKNNIEKKRIEQELKELREKINSNEKDRLYLSGNFISKEVEKFNSEMQKAVDILDQKIDIQALEMKFKLESEKLTQLAAKNRAMAEEYLKKYGPNADLRNIDPETKKEFEETLKSHADNRKILDQIHSNEKRYFSKVNGEFMKSREEIFQKISKAKKEIRDKVKALDLELPLLQGRENKLQKEFNSRKFDLQSNDEYKRKSSELRKELERLKTSYNKLVSESSLIRVEILKERRKIDRELESLIEMEMVQSAVKAVKSVNEMPKVLGSVSSSCNESNQNNQSSNENEIKQLIGVYNGDRGNIIIYLDFFRDQKSGKLESKIVMRVSVDIANKKDFKNVIFKDGVSIFNLSEMTEQKVSHPINVLNFFKKDNIKQMQFKNENGVLSLTLNNGKLSNVSLAKEGMGNRVVSVNLGRIAKVQQGPIVNISEPEQKNNSQRSFLQRNHSLLVLTNPTKIDLAIKLAQNLSKFADYPELFPLISKKVNSVLSEVSEVSEDKK
ncbi:MAG: hypothetical protein HQK49_20550 [Oligoflexia bacterium]|nr:hypothetical protein [Oligoflexia bacterium]